MCTARLINMKIAFKFLKKQLYFLTSIVCIYAGTYQAISGIDHKAMYKGGRQSRERIIEGVRWDFDSELLANGITLLFLGFILLKTAFLKQKN